MASSSLKYDSCSYEEKLRRSVGPGMYQLVTPANDCDTCSRDVPADPYLRYQAWGPGFCAPGAAVDDGNELRGLNYKASKCSTDAYLPGKYAPKGICTPSGSAEGRACVRPTEPTRLSNPPCTLRSTGWNRWEWLCENPQDRAIRPFEWNTSYRIVAKDNHVPCLATPLDQSCFTPGAPGCAASAGPSAPTSFTGMDAPMQAPTAAASWTPPAGCGAQGPGNPFAPALQTCSSIRKN